MQPHLPTAKRSYILYLLLWAGILTAAVSTPSPAVVYAAQEQDVSLEILPSAIQLKPNKPVEILLILRNPTTTALDHIELTSFTDLNVTVESNIPVTVLPPGGLLPLKATITQPHNYPVVGKLHFQFSYSQKSEAGAIPGTVTGTLEIQAPSVEKVEEMAEVRIETTLDQIEEQRPGLVFLVVHNLVSHPIWITGVTARKPDFVTITEPDLSTELELAAQETHVFSIPVTLEDAVQTGPQRLLFDIALSWKTDSGMASGSLVAAHTINVGIIGESDLLQLLGVPSFLFLPGFLMITTFVMLWSRISPKTSFNFSASEFALLSITLSLFAMLLYPLITTVVYGKPSDYLGAYGLRDVYQVWFGSVAVGFMLWVLFSGGISLTGRISQFVQARRAQSAERKRREGIASRTPQEDDKPVQAVEKMGMNNVLLPLEEAEIELHGHPIRGFILQQDPADPSAVWVSPSILLKPLESTGPEAAQYRERRTQYLTQISEAHTAQDLAAVLGKAADTWDIAWNKRGDLSGPKRVLQADLKDRRRSARQFVEPE